MLVLMLDNNMKIVGAKFAIPRYEVEAKKNFPSFKEYVLKSLSHSLAEEIMLTQKTPIPEVRDDIYNYELRFGICSYDEARRVANQIKELYLWRTKFSHNQYIIDKAILDHEIEILQGKG